MFAALGFGAFWLASAVYIYATGDIEARTDCTMEATKPPQLYCADAADAVNCHCGYETKMDENLQYMLLYHLFGLLWTTQFLQAITYLTLASVFATFYFGGGSYGNSLAGWINTPALQSFRKAGRAVMGANALQKGRGGEEHALLERGEGGKQVRQRPDFFLQRNIHAADRGAVQPCACHLDEATLHLAVGRLHPSQGEIDGARAAKSDRLPGALGGERDAQFAGEHVHRAERQDAELHLAKSVALLCQAVDNLVDRAVAAGGDDGFVAITNRLRG